MSKIKAEKKVKIVLEGMKKGKSEVCEEYDISELEFKQWKSKLIESAEAVFNPETVTEQEIDRAVRKALRNYRMKLNRVK